MTGINEAIAIASFAHQGQKDKNGEPYIFHPLRVMLSLSREVDQIVAVLHDVVEDSDMKLSDIIGAGFSPEVVEAVAALTRRDGETYADFIARAKQNDIACRVKIADIEDNLRPGAEHLRGRYLMALAVLEAS